MQHRRSVKFRAAPEFRGALFIYRFAALACLLAVVTGVVAFAPALTGELQQWTEGHAAPFTLPSTSGTDIALSSARGHVVLVHFFATWCEPCREELPALNRLAARADSTVKMLVISVAEVDLRVRRFIETLPVNFPVLLDHKRAVTKAWKVYTLPTTFVLDETLRPRLVVETDSAWDSVDPSKLTDMLAVNASRAAAWQLASPRPVIARVV